MSWLRHVCCWSLVLLFAAAAIAEDQAPSPEQQARWRAFVVCHGEEGALLRVEGIIRGGTPGHYADIRQAAPQGINPRILILKVAQHQLPGIWTQVVTEIPACFMTSVDRDQYDQVTLLMPGGQSTTVDVLDACDAASP